VETLLNIELIGRFFTTKGPIDIVRAMSSSITHVLLLT